MAKKPFPFSVCEKCCDGVDDAALEQIEKELENKVDKESGKGLSANDYTDTEKLKVAEAISGIDRLWVSLDGTQQTVGKLSKDTLIATKSNEKILRDCADGPVTSLNLYGYCAPYGTPTPEIPVELYPVEPPVFRGCGADFYTLNPSVLFGIPVASGGNYTDEHGQEWICDEIDVANRIYTKRCQLYEITGDENFGKIADTWKTDGFYHTYINTKPSGYTDNPYASANGSGNAERCLSTSLIPSKYAWSGATEKNLVCSYGNVIALSLDNHLTGVVEADSHEEKIEKMRNFVKELRAMGKAIRVLYPLAAPIETQFTDATALAEFAKMRTTYPSVELLSTANILIGYQATVQGYIDKKFEKMTNAIISLGGNV